LRRQERNSIVAIIARAIPLRSFGRGRALAIVVTAIVLALTVAEWAGPLAEPSVRGFYVARDFDLYRDAAARWLAGGGFYLPHELSGPFLIEDGDILYPPTTLYLFVAFTVLPAVLWWIVPIAAVSWVLGRLRPDPIVWPALALCLFYPNTGIKLLTGNPAIWMAAGVGLGVIWPGPAIVAFLKPTLAPFALWGIRHRRWWIALATLVVISLPFGALWMDYVDVLVNAQTPAGLAYSGGEAPLLAIPFIAWLARTDGPRSRAPAA
jgi:hypothetical protein